MNTQSEARHFFATKVIDRARTEGVILSDAERQMLYWSESDPEFKADPELVEQLASAMSDEDYEAKIATLLQNAFAADSAIDSRAREVWQQARSVLKRGDHYILIMIDHAVGKKAQSLVGVLEVIVLAHQPGASWNALTSWLHRLDDLRRAASLQSPRLRNSIN